MPNLLESLFTAMEEVFADDLLSRLVSRLCISVSLFATFTFSIVVGDFLNRNVHVVIYGKRTVTPPSKDPRFQRFKDPRYLENLP